MRNAVHKLTASKPGNYTPMERVPKQEPPYMMGADLDYMWHSWQIQALKEDYNAGLPVMDIAYRLGKGYREVLYMIIDQAHFGKLEPREGGVF